eukprot:6352753-Prymnesium_polylepis.1
MIFHPVSSVSISHRLAFKAWEPSVANNGVDCQRQAISSEVAHLTTPETSHHSSWSLVRLSGQPAATRWGPRAGLRR